MGRIFLLAIVAAGIYGAYGLYSNISEITKPEKRPEAERAAAPVSVKAEGEDSGAAIKEVPVESSSEKKDPLPVLASNCQWLQIEAWAIVRKGDPLPDGAILESWDKWHATVVTEAGIREKRRFRTVGEALAKLVPVAPVAAAETGSGGWFGGDKK